MDDMKEVKSTDHEFEDAQETTRLHPASSKLPAIEYYQHAVKPGDFVKICHMRERFWVQVIALLYDPEGNKIAGLVMNDLTVSTLKYDDPVIFEYKNIYDLMDQKVASENKAKSEIHNTELVHEYCIKPRNDYH